MDRAGKATAIVLTSEAAAIVGAGVGTGGGGSGGVLLGNGGIGGRRSATRKEFFIYSLSTMAITWDILDCV